MSNLKDFFLNPVADTPKIIKNGYAVAGWIRFSTGLLGVNAPPAGGIAYAASGAMTANTLATVLSITGSGVLNLLGVGSLDATSRTMRMKLTLDGVVVFDYTSGACVAANYGGFCVGGHNATDGTFFDQIPFATSCLFEAASSLTETNKMGFYTKYRTN